MDPGSEAIDSASEAINSASEALDSVTSVQTLPEPRPVMDSGSEVMDPGSEAINSALEALDSVTSVQTLPEPRSAMDPGSVAMDPGSEAINSASMALDSVTSVQTLPEPRPAMNPGSVAMDPLSEAMDSALEAINLASEALDLVTSVQSLSMAMDSFQLREENNRRGTGVVVYFRTFTDKCSIEESTHWYAFLLEDNSSNPNPPSDNFCLPDYPISPKILQPFSKTYQSRSSVAVGLGSFIYVLGGRLLQGNYEFNHSNEVYRYNTEVNADAKWEEVSPMNMGRSQFSSAVLDGKIYVQGGLNEVTAEIDEIRTNWVEYFDPEIGRWEILPLVKFQGESLPLFDVLNPTVGYDYFSYRRKYDEGYFKYTMTPLGPYELVFSSEKSHFPSYVYNIRYGSLVEMEGEKDFMKFPPSEPPIVIGRTRYCIESGFDSESDNLIGYRFDKFCWVKNSQTSVFMDWKFPEDFVRHYYLIVPRADGSSIASQGDQFYVLFVHHLHNSYCEIRCNRFVVSHDRETSANNLEEPFEQLDVCVKPSISRFITYGENLQDGLLLDKQLLK